VELWISLHDSPSSPVLHWTLTCQPNGGTLPGPGRACGQLQGINRPFGPMATGVMCPMIDFGSQTASVTGYWYGSWISVRLSRSDGCQEARWNKIISALGLTIFTGEINPGGPMQPGPATPLTR
jgi:Subtilisin inhibitor-like